MIPMGPITVGLDAAMKGPAAAGMAVTMEKDTRPQESYFLGRPANNMELREAILTQKGMIADPVIYRNAMT